MEEQPNANRGPTSHLITHTAVLGRTMLMPAIQPVTVSSPDGECLVAHAYPATITDPRHGIAIDITDCTLFTVTHLDRELVELAPPLAEALLEQALQAISEVTIWNKTLDRVGKNSSYLRQIGRLDVKYFFLEFPDGRLVAWSNPLFDMNRNGLSMMSGLFSNMINRNGPSANPVPPVVRRIMASLDLINLGFYTESFVNLFSLFDDLTQEVLRAGFAKKGLKVTQQNNLLRAIKEERLRVYLTHLVKLCDWKALDENNPKLYKKLVQANSIRNKIMHGPKRLARGETIESTSTLLEAINWLRTNPFGYSIPKFPLLVVAEAQFVLLDAVPDEAKDESKTDRGSPTEGTEKERKTRNRT